MGYYHRIWVGFSIAAFSLGQAFGAPLLGSLSDRFGSCIVLFASLLLTITGDLLYAFSEDIQLLVASRLIAGVGGGNQAVLQAYLVHNTSPDELTLKFNLYVLTLSVSLVVGPGIGALLYFIGDIPIIGTHRFNYYTSPAYASAIIGLLNLVLVSVFVREAKVRTPGKKEKKIIVSINTEVGTIPAPESKEKGSMDSDEEVIKETDALLSNTSSLMSSEKKLMTVESTMFYTQLSNRQSVDRALPILAILFFANFAIYSSNTIFDTLITPLARDDFDWGLLESFVQWTITGAISVMSFFIQAKVLRRHLSEQAILALGLTFLATGWGVFLEMNAHSEPPISRFIVGAALIAIGLPWAVSYCTALYSKIIGSSSQGSLLGFLMTGGALARISAPIWSTMSYDATRGLLVFPIMSAILILAVALILASRNAGNYLIDTNN